MYTQMRETVTILGSKGTIVIDSPAHLPSRVVLTKYTDKGSEESVSLFPLPEVAPDAKYAYGATGLLYEAEAVTDAIRNKQTELSDYPVDESLGIQKIMDEIRKQLGLVYDADSK
jgi:dihydrodiol dehydrogenase / D-xylose 1-dehydrogenase (NADP)